MLFLSPILLFCSFFSDVHRSSEPFYLAQFTVSKLYTINLTPTGLSLVYASVRDYSVATASNLQRQREHEVL